MNKHGLKKIIIQFLLLTEVRKNKTTTKKKIKIFFSLSPAWMSGR